MRLATNLNPIISTNIFSIKHAGQSITQNNRNPSTFASPFQRDSLSLSPQGKAANMIDSLMKQKIAIQDRKNSFMSSALEEGQSMDNIQAKLDSYDEQIKEIDKQISEISAKQLEEANDKKKSTIEDHTPKTEQEIENQKMQSLMELSMGLDEVTTVHTVQTKIDGDSAVLKSEIELSDGLLREKKEEKLAELQKKSMDLTAEISGRLTDLIEKTQKDNEIVEKAEDNKIEDSADSSKELKISDVIQSKIEQYKQQMTELSKTETSLVNASA